MKRSKTQKLFAIAAVVAILVGGTLAAVTAGKGAAREKPGPLAAAAEYLGVSSAQLRSELRSGKSLAEIANATSGKSSAGLSAVLLATAKEKLAAAQANLPKRVDRLLNRVEVPGQRTAAARYLGLKPSQIAAQRRAGKTLAQIANATPGKSAAGLIEALVAEKRRHIAAVSASLPKRVTAEVNRSAGPHRIAPGARHARLFGRRSLGLIAASYLGVPALQVRQELQAGRTLAQIADATSGKSATGLVQALIQARREALAAAVASGALPQAKADKLMARLPQRIARAVNRPLHSH